MAAPLIIVSHRIALQLPRGEDAARRLRGGDLEIALDGEQRARLVSGDEKSVQYAGILAGLAELGQPVYLEVDRDDGAIRLLRIPDVGRLAGVRDMPGGVSFELDTGQARFLLSEKSPAFSALADILREAGRGGKMLVVTTDDRHEVIDVRFFLPGPDDGPRIELPFDRPRPAIDWSWIWRWRLWPWNWWLAGCVSASRAQSVFDQMNATSCAPFTVPAPCIPFLFPDDGCWARAHEMARLMIAMGLSPRKVWIRGWLTTPTRNNPHCFVYWGWHVAPTLCVRRPWSWRFWWWGRRTMVIDPSLFTRPVTVDEWKGVQGDPAATLTYTAASDYLWGDTDPTYAKTNDRLAFYRLRLRERAINVGPPPYANCP